MNIITIRTDKPQAELALYEDSQSIDRMQWQADRQLAETIHQQLQALLTAHQLELSTVHGVVVFAGPGSFTGLRIGISVANSLAYALQCPVVGTSGDDWQDQGVAELASVSNDKNRTSYPTAVVPEYGMAPHITAQKK